MGACCCCFKKDNRKKKEKEKHRDEQQRHHRDRKQKPACVPSLPTRVEGEFPYSLLQPGQVCIATFPYDPGCSAEVKLQKGDRVELLSKEQDSEDFVFVRQLKQDGVRGYVATNVLAPEGSIEAEDYYFGAVRRRDAVKILRNEELPPGAFLIRDSETHYTSHYEGGGRGDRLTDTSTQYVLSVKDNGRNLHHYRIYDAGSGDRRFYISSASRFSTIQNIVNHYKTHEVLSEICTKLTTPVIRPPPVRKVLAKDFQERWREIPRSQIQIVKEIGVGNFGRVCLATWKQPGGCPIEVAVKQLKDVTAKARDDLFNEASAMRDLIHKNIVRLYGVVSTGEPYMMVTEYMKDKSLKEFLQNRRMLLQPPVPDGELVDISTQICRGMAYLESKGVVHRDLAARNVLINLLSERPVKIEAKISDFGLARVLHNTEVYQMARDTPMARKWLAPEAFNKNQFTSKSDVWAFGATLCEIFGEGEDPFPNYDAPVILKYVKHGKRPPVPKAMRRANVQEIYKKCTKPYHKERPTFESLVAELESLGSSGEDPL